MITCKNGSDEFEGHFCNNCGQKASIGRLNWSHLWHEALHNLLHFDKSFLSTLKDLFIRPGLAIQEYIDGKRVRHFSPFSMLVVFGAIAAFLTQYFDLHIVYKEGH